jgi:hypothetical protein
MTVPQAAIADDIRNNSGDFRGHPDKAKSCVGACSRSRLAARSCPVRRQLRSRLHFEVAEDAVMPVAAICLRKSPKNRNTSPTVTPFLQRWAWAAPVCPKAQLSFPNIISARNDDVIRTEPVWRRRSRIARRLALAARPCPTPDVCASHYNRPSTTSAPAANVIRQSKQSRRSVPIRRST